MLEFDPSNYVTETKELGGETVTYRAFRDINYCEKPVNDVQKLNLFVSEDLCRGPVNGYTQETAPIFIPNTVGGYMEGPLSEPGPGRDGKANAAFRALKHGYVVCCPGIRGNNTPGDVGHAPALIVDMKAVIRYIRHNSAVIPGDAEKMITNGTSAGGALSSLAGTTGNAEAYKPYLEAIGAADERDDIFAASCYCPIVNLENADKAYEWQFDGIYDAHRMNFRMENGKPVIEPVDSDMTEDQICLSRELKAAFPAYLNSLKVKDENGNVLSLDENGEGSFKEYLKSWILRSAQNEIETHEYKDANPVAGSEIEKADCLVSENGKYTGFDWKAYMTLITRMKTAPAFDAMDLQSPETWLFGYGDHMHRHFTDIAQAHSDGSVPMADPATVALLNPYNFVSNPGCTKHWRIRHGSFDRDTALAVPVVLQALLKEQGYDVDFFLPWGVPHSGDYDLDSLFAWIDRISK